MSKPVPIPARQHLEDLLRRIDAISAEVEEVGQGLTPSQLRWRPEPERWSIAHCLEHLINTTEAYEDPVLAGIDGAGRTPAPRGGGTYRPGWLGRWFIRAAGPEGRMRFPAPKQFAPSPEVPGRVRERFATSQEHLRHLIVEAHDVDLDESRVKHPFLPLIHFSVGEALELMVGHQRRHLEQAKRVRHDPGFPVSPLDGMG